MRAETFTLISSVFSALGIKHDTHQLLKDLREMNSSSVLFLYPHYAK